MSPTTKGAHGEAKRPAYGHQEPCCKDHPSESAPRVRHIIHAMAHGAGTIHPDDVARLAGVTPPEAVEALGAACRAGDVAQAEGLAEGVYVGDVDKTGVGKARRSEAKAERKRQKMTGGTAA